MLQLRILIIVFFTIIAIFWPVYGSTQFPWIVPADSIGTSSIEKENIAYASGVMFIVSLLGTAATSGLLGNGAVKRGIVAALIFVSIGLGPWFYPRYQFAERWCVLIVHVLEILALFTTLVYPKKGSDTVIRRAGESI